MSTMQCYYSLMHSLAYKDQLIGEKYFLIAGSFLIEITVDLCNNCSFIISVFSSEFATKNSEPAIGMQHDMLEQDQLLNLHLVWPRVLAGYELRGWKGRVTTIHNKRVCSGQRENMKQKLKS